MKVDDIYKKFTAKQQAELDRLNAGKQTWFVKRRIQELEKMKQTKPNYISMKEGNHFLPNEAADELGACRHLLQRFGYDIRLGESLYDKLEEILTKIYPNDEVHIRNNK